MAEVAGDPEITGAVSGVRLAVSGVTVMEKAGSDTQPLPRRPSVTEITMFE